MKVTINMFCDLLLADGKFSVLKVFLTARKLDPSIKLETVEAIYDVKYTLDSCIMFGTNTEYDKQTIARLTSEYEAILSEGILIG